MNGSARPVLTRTAAALAVLSLCALAAVAGSPARTAAVEPTPWGADWTADAKVVRGKPGSRFDFICPGKGRLDQIWGTTIYTDDSSVCTAAVQQGLITVADGGTVTVEHLPGQSSYTGSTANGVTSSNYAAWSGSFRVVGAVKGGGVAGVKMGGGSWRATASGLRGDNGSRYRYVCPGGGYLGAVWGTNTYTDDSSVCTAAVQVGLVNTTDGGRVTIEVRPGQDSYQGFTANGVRSSDYGLYQGSYVFAGAAPIPGSSGGGSSSAVPTGTVTGTVTVGGAPFTGGTIPFGKTVDVTEGSVLLKSAAGSLRVTPADGATAAFVLVRGTANGKPIVELRLAKGDFSACPKRKTSSAGRGPATVVRQVWGNGKGNFRTRGRYAAATVRGTRWLTSDRCDGTLTTVARGIVSVVDLKTKKTVTVRAGRSYLAKP